MTENTKVEWATHTHNQWWGCTHVGPGCDNCYAESLARRWGRKVWGAGVPRWRTSEKNRLQPYKWNARCKELGIRESVFCGSMMDIYDHEVLPAWREGLWTMIEETPHLDWLLLTKRISAAKYLVPLRWLKNGWPSNVRQGITVVNQAEADRDVPRVIELGVQNFVSYEPALEGVSFRWIGGDRWRDTNGVSDQYDALNRLGWVVIGGESGGRARPFSLSWARALVAECQDSGTPVFVKQMGANPQIEYGTQGEMAKVGFQDDKGGDISEWPRDLQVRQFPARVTV